MSVTLYIPIRVFLLSVFLVENSRHVRESIGLTPCNQLGTWHVHERPFRLSWLDSKLNDRWIPLSWLETQIVQLTEDFVIVIVRNLLILSQILEVLYFKCQIPRQVLLDCKFLGLFILKRIHFSVSYLQLTFCGTILLVYSWNFGDNIRTSYSITFYISTLTFLSFWVVSLYLFSVYLKDLDFSSYKLDFLNISSIVTPGLSSYLYRGWGVGGFS